MSRAGETLTRYDDNHKKKCIDHRRPVAPGASRKTTRDRLISIRKRECFHPRWNRGAPRPGVFRPGYPRAFRGNWRARDIEFQSKLKERGPADTSTLPRLLVDRSGLRLHHSKPLASAGNGILAGRKRDGPIPYRAQDGRPHMPRWNLRHVAGRELRRNGQLENSRRYRRGGSTAGYLVLGINNGGRGAQIIAHLFRYRINRQIDLICLQRGATAIYRRAIGINRELMKNHVS